MRALSGNRSRRRLSWAVLALVIVTLAAAACSGDIRSGEAEVYGVAKFTLPAVPETGSTVVEVFNEMHYQPSYKSQEGPRLLPPEGSVPVTGRELQYTSLEEHKALTVPERFAASYNPTAAQRLFSVNCMVCHGPTLRGSEEPDGTRKAKILPFMTRGPFPADLLGPIAREATDGELFAFISNGGRQGYAATERGSRSSSPMPNFRLLLGEEERWSLVLYLRAAQQTAP